MDGSSTARQWWLRMARASWHTLAFTVSVAPARSSAQIAEGPTQPAGHVQE